MRRLGRSSGFTLIELLIVILIIGILIAVSAPSFLGQVSKAHDSATKQNLALVYREAIAARTDNDGVYSDNGNSYLVGADLAATIQDSEPQLHLSFGDYRQVLGQTPDYVVVDTYGDGGFVAYAQSASGKLICANAPPAGPYSLQDFASQGCPQGTDSGGSSTGDGSTVGSSGSSPSSSSGDTSDGAATAANVDTSSYTLTVNLGGDRQGTVSSNESPSPAIVCGVSCQATYAALTSGSPTVVQLTAAADSGHAFYGWAGDACDNSDADATATCDVTIDTVKGVAAIFVAASDPNCSSSCSPTSGAGAEPPVHQDLTALGAGPGELAVRLAGTGTGVVESSSVAPAAAGDPINCLSTCDQLYDGGAQVTLEAKAAKGSSFAGWSGLADLKGTASGDCSGSGDCSLTIAAEDVYEVTATFVAGDCSAWTVKGVCLGQGGAAASGPPQPEASPPYSQVVLADGPVAYWQLNDASGTTGAAIADATGNGHDGAVYGGALAVSPSAGPFTGAGSISFDNAAHYVRVPSATALNASADGSGNINWTVEYWAQTDCPAGVCGAASVLSKRHNDTYGYVGWAVTSSAGGAVSYSDSDDGTLFGSESATTQSTVPDGSWSYYAVTDQNGVITTYRDGVQIALASYAANRYNGSLPTYSETSSLILGQLASGSATALSNVAVYDKTLTPIQISSHFSASHQNDAGGSQPAITAAPVIQGSTVQGQTLTATEGGYSGATTVQYQWQSSATGVDGWTDITAVGPATASYGYQTLTADGGRYLRVDEIVTNAHGAISSPSNVIGPISDSPYVAAVKAQSPIAYWPLDGRLNGIVSPEADLSGHGHDGHLVKSPQTSSPTSGPFIGAGAITADDASKYATVPTDPALNDSADGSGHIHFSVEFWAKTNCPSSTCGAATVIAKRHSETYGYVGWAVTMAADGSLTFTNNNDGSLFGDEFGTTQPGVVSDGTWSHYVFTDNDGSVTAYQNGSQLPLASVGSYRYNGSLPTYSETSALNIGVFGSGSATQVSNVALYDTVLAPAEIAGHFQAASTVDSSGAGPTVSSPPTVSGSTVQGQTLNVSRGSYGGTGDTVSYVWQSSANGSSGWSNVGSYATAPASYSYQTTSPEVGLYLRVLEKATNSHGSTSAASNVVGPITDTPYVAAVKADSPAAYWPMDDASLAKFATIRDASGNGHNGSVAGGALAAAAGPFAGSQAISFSSASNYVSVPYSTAFNVSAVGGYTVEFWAKTDCPSGVCGALNVFLKRHSDTYGPVGWILNTSANGSFTFSVNYDGTLFGYGTGTSPTGALSAGSWNYFAVTDANGTMTAYENGSPIAWASTSKSGSPNPVDTSALTIGQFVSGSSTALSNVAVYDSALSPAQIAAHYAAH